MKWSMFVFKVEKDESVLLYNMLNYGIILFDKKEYRKIDELICRGKGTSNEYLQTLIEQEFIVNSKLNEQEVFMDVLKKEYNDDQRMCIQVLPTTACNFKCVYCYQEGINRDCFMTKETVCQIESFVRNYLDSNNKIKKINLILHGGEPTLYWENVPLVFDVIKSICNDYGLTYDTQIITNGYQLTEEKIQILVKNNLHNVQVTIDGIGDVHELRRISKFHKPSFEQIISNIHKLLTYEIETKVNIRINYDKANCDSVEETIEYLHNEFDDTRVKVSLGYITKTLDELESNKYINEYGITLEELPEYYPRFHSLLRKYGYSDGDIFNFDGLCVSKMRHNMIISPKGDIYKCPSGVGVDDFVVGNVNKLCSTIPDYVFFELYDECFKKKCPFIPICHTSCRFIAKTKYGEISRIDCKREILEKINSILLADQYIES